MLDDDKWMSIADAARVEGVSNRTIQRRINKGQYATKTVDEKRVVRLSDDSDIQMSEVSQEVSQATLIAQLKQENERLTGEVEGLRQVVRQKDEDIRAERAAAEETHRATDEASQRHDTVVMQMSKLLEYEQQPFWRRWFRHKALPVPKNIVAMEPDIQEKTAPSEN